MLMKYLLLLLVILVGFFLIAYPIIKKNTKKSKRNKEYERWLKRVRKKGKNW